MAKPAPATETSTATLFYVGIDKKPHHFPLMGLVDDSQGKGDAEVRHATRPMALHYRPLDYNGRREDRWLTEDEAQRYAEDNGFDKIPAKWQKRKRPRFNLVSRMFKGCVIEARSKGDAQSQFMETFGITDVSTKNLTVRSVPSGTRLGLVNPVGKNRPTEV